MAPSKTICDVVRHVWHQPTTLMSDFAQKNMRYIAMAASMQLITTRVIASTYGNIWRVTSKGLRLINEMEQE